MRAARPRAEPVRICRLVERHDRRGRLVAHPRGEPVGRHEADVLAIVCLDPRMVGVADLPQRVDLGRARLRNGPPEDLQPHVIACDCPAAPGRFQVHAGRPVVPSQGLLNAPREMKVAPCLGERPRRDLEQDADPSPIDPAPERTRDRLVECAGAVAGDDDRALCAAGIDRARGRVVGNEDNVVVVEPGTMHPVIGSPVDDRHADQPERQPVEVETRIVGDDGIERSDHVGDRIGRDGDGLPAARVGGGNEGFKSAVTGRHRELERVASPGRAPVECLAHHGPMEPRTPLSDEAIAVRAVPRSPLLHLQFVARGQFAVPQRGTSVVHKQTAGLAELQAQVDVLLPVVVARGEAAGRLESRSANEKTCRGKRDGVADHPRVGGKGVAAGVEWDRNRHPVVHPEANSTVLERQFGERVDARITRLATRIHQPRTHRGRAPCVPRFDEVAEPPRIDRFDIVVEQEKPVAGGGGGALVIAI